MRFTEFKLISNKTQLNEGYTKGDLAETVWGAAVTAAFENYPSAATESDIIRIINNLKQSGKNLTYTSTRDDGLKSDLTDNIVFNNIINMQAHISDLNQIESSIKSISKEVPGILQDANAQVNKLDLKTIFANGKADVIQIGAQGGADQKGTKVDVSIIHTVEGEQQTTNFGYSLKTDTSASGIMPVSQATGVDKGTGGQINFFNDLGIIKDIDEASIDEYKKLDAELRELVDKNASGGKLEKEFEKELNSLKKSNEAKQIFNKNIQTAADQINNRVKTNTEEKEFLNNLVAFFKKHINKDVPGIFLLTFDKQGAYTSTVEKFEENVQNLTLEAEANLKSSFLGIYARNEDGSRDLIVKIRFKTSGGRFSGSQYRKQVKKKGAENASGYELLRYTIVIETGPGYKKSAAIN